MRCNKHIPPTYLRASVAQRLALLQGLMDTDGHAALDGGCEFDNTSERLARDVLELALSLGLKATILEGAAKLNGVEVSRKWRVRFTTSLPVFGLTRKLERLNPAPRRTNAFRYLVACERVDSVPTRCIAVDSPTRQYLAGTSLIPTHNTDLGAGTILRKSERALFIRREKAQCEGVIQRLNEILGTSKGFNSTKGIWNIPNGGLCEFGGLDNPGDERRWQGRPHDKKIFDEVTEMREQQVRFIMGWTRTSNPELHAQVWMFFNPPTTSEGRWVIDFFGPWLDKKHPLFPTPAGQIRYCAMLPDGNGGTSDKWLDRGDAFILVDGEPCYEFDPAEHRKEDIIEPKSRTFIPARVTDNPYYMESGYMSTLQSLPEPLRSQMLYGDFAAGMKDNAFQVCPTAWVEAAQARWTMPDKLQVMNSMGVDVARGGADKTVIARRHGMWFDRPIAYPGKDTPDGPETAGLVIAAKRDAAPIHIDVIGVGSSPFDFLRTMGQQVIGVNVSEAPFGLDKTGQLKFLNRRTELWWRFREALDPANNTGIALPPDKELLRELTAACWKAQGKTIQVESRDDIIAKIGKSPDYASAYLLALMDTPVIAQVLGALNKQEKDYDPYA